MHSQKSKNYYYTYNFFITSDIVEEVLTIDPLIFASIICLATA